MKYLNPISAMTVLLLVGASVGLTAVSAHAIGFAPRPGQGAPSQATGGASRGAIKFAPARGQGAPSQATGGASRGAIGFVPRPGQGAPSQATGGASRGSFFKPPTGQGAPQQATGGASRGRLFKPAKGRGSVLRASGGASRVARYDINMNSPIAAAGPAALIAMLPESYSGTTVSARPTLMAYLPASTAKTAVFSLKDEAGNTVYQKNLNVTGEAEMMAIALPADAPELAINQYYQWYVALNVEGELNPSTPYVDGWIQRIEPSANVQAAMKQGDLLKQAEVLGAEGIWYDCVAKLAALRVQQPDNEMLQKQWTELLGSVGLQEVSQVQLSAAVTP
jgi:hypothetical protein